MNDEAVLIGRLSEEMGYDVRVPADPGPRWELLRSLMNVRPPEEVDEETLAIQDRLLRRMTESKGLVDADSFDFSNGPVVWRGDITRLRCDAIVNAANSGMTGCYAPCHRCIDNAIHTFAGMQLRLECARMMDGKQEPTGSARITGAYNLPCKHVIHTVGPIVRGQLTAGNEEDLRSCYESCMRMAERNEIRTIAFCCISTGEFGFPQKRAAEIAVETVEDMMYDDARVIFDVFTDADERIYGKLLRD